MVTRACYLHISESGVLQRMHRHQLRIAPAVHHGWIEALRVAVDRKPRPARIRRAPMRDAVSHVGPDDVHVRQLDRERTGWGENAPPLLEGHRRIPRIEVFENVDRADGGEVAVTEGERANVSPERRGYALGEVEVDPASPVSIAAPDLEAHAASQIVFQAAATVWRLNGWRIWRCRRAVVWFAS